jgi:hypothetical protein
VQSGNTGSRSKSQHGHSHSALARRSCFAGLDALVDPINRSPTSQRLTGRLAKKI